MRLKIGPVTQTSPKPVRSFRILHRRVKPVRVEAAPVVVTVVPD